LDERGYYDVYFDDLIDAVPGGGKLSSIDAGGYENNERGAFRKPIFDDTSVFIASTILGRLRPATRDITAFAQLSKLLADEIELPAFTPEHIRRKYSVFQWRRFCYRLVLGRLQARAVLVPNSGQFSLYMAARDLGIPFVEMQHGLFTDTHPDCLPAYALESDADVMLPDLMTVYGTYTAGLLAETAVGRAGRIRIVGNPEIERGRAERARAFRPNRERPVVTLTAQAVPEAAEFAAQFLRLYRGDLKFNLRLHPGYNSERDFAESGILDDRRVTVIPGQALPSSYELIARSDVHLSVYSSCHYDAIGIRTPTMVIPGSGYQAISDLIDHGHAVLLTSPEELARTIADAAWSPVAESTSRSFFEPDFRNNMRVLLEELESCDLTGHDDGSEVKDG
jgi:hypothetical protein